MSFQTVLAIPQNKIIILAKESNIIKIKGFCCYSPHQYFYSYRDLVYKILFLLENLRVMSNLIEIHNIPKSLFFLLFSVKICKKF